ncbi:TetR/AcrR family transcriptional regulator [Peribacillus loiseleuriae]|uniref:TetR/AcrR family transcriptional regulator n=1 Tax=Peribacillus loiseleuriae TaxID=1679170 RepID=UPI000670C49B|nr:TetR/AcrR family transcriptional regulator [Peribacillus loiseleuriae]
MDGKKLEIIPIAMRLFSEKGYESTTVDEIAKESGMAKGSFYKHFNSKEDLLLEIFIQMPKQVKTGLTKIYSNEYASTHEKLLDFISMSLENILSNQVHLLIDLFFKLPVFKNKEMAIEAQKIEFEFNIWLKEFLLDLYGEQVKIYIWDLVSLLKALMFQYIHLCRRQKLEIASEKLAVFIATVFDIVIEGLLERKPESVLNKDWTELEMVFADNESPRLKGHRIQLLLKKMTSTVSDIKKDAADQEEYLKTISLLEEEQKQRKPKSFLLKALIHYLQSVPELQGDCEELKILLEIDG